MDLTKFLIDIGKPVVYYPKLNKITGGVNNTIFLSQLIYWTGKQNDKEGWIYKTQKEIEEETGLSRYEQESARKTLKKKGLIEEKKMGVPCKLYFKVNVEAVNKAWQEILESPEKTLFVEDYDLQSQENSQFGVLPQTSLRENHKQECGFSTNKNGEKPQTITESTTYITTDNTTEITLNNNKSTTSNNKCTLDSKLALDDYNLNINNNIPAKICGENDLPVNESEEVDVDKSLSAELTMYYRKILAFANIPYGKSDFSYMRKLYNEYGYEDVLLALDELREQIEEGLIPANIKAALIAKLKKKKKIPPPCAENLAPDIDRDYKTDLGNISGKEVLKMSLEEFDLWIKDWLNKKQ